MPNFASITLIGHLGQNPETRYTPGGESVTSFSIATTVNRKKDNELTTWWRCTAWGKRGETIAQYLGKGDPILVQGEPSLRPYQAKDGSEKVSLEVSVRDWTFVGGKDASQSPQEPRRAPAARQGGGQGRAAAPASQGPVYDDDIPF